MNTEDSPRVIMQVTRATESCLWDPAGLPLGDRAAPTAEASGPELREAHSAARARPLCARLAINA